MLTVTAHITLLKTEEGGRTGVMHSGYRLNLRFGALYTDGAVTFVDRQQAAPGATCAVRVTLVHPDYVGASLAVGAHFDLMAGPHNVGEGIILAIPATDQRHNEARHTPGNLVRSS